MARPDIATLDLAAPLEEVFAVVRDAVREEYKKGSNVFVYRFGFLRLPFVADRSIPGKYLHVWLDALPRDDFPHRHSFHMRSRVLAGSITNRIWRLEESGDEGTHMRLRTLYLPGDKTGNERVGGLVTPRLVSEETVQRSGMYYQDNLVYHTSLVHESPTVTLAEKFDLDSDDSNSFKVVPVGRTDVMTKETDLIHDNQTKAWETMLSVVETLG